MEWLIPLSPTKCKREEREPKEGVRTSEQQKEHWYLTLFYS